MFCQITTKKKLRTILRTFYKNIEYLGKILKKIRSYYENFLKH